MPDGAVAAMATRAGVALCTEEATRAMAAYKGRRHLQPDFIADFLRLVPSKATDEATTAAGPGASPAQPHPTVGEWPRRVQGPYTSIAGRSTYAQDLDGWRVAFEEFLMQIEAATEQSTSFLATAGLDLERTTSVHALGAYAARKGL